MANIMRLGNSGSTELTGNATPSDVLKGKTFYNTDEDNKQTGTLELTGNASPNDVASGKTFYSNDVGKKLTGTLPILHSGHGASLYISSTGKFYIESIPEGIYKDDGTGQRRPDAWVDANLLGNAYAGHILSGITASSERGINMTGEMANRGSWGTTINPGDSITIPEGYHSGHGTVRANQVYKGGVAWNGNAHATSPTLDSHNAPISYILFSCYDGQTYECYLDWSDDGYGWHEWTHSGGGSGQYVGSIRRGSASGHRYWRLRAGSAPNWSLGGAIFIN